MGNDPDGVRSFALSHNPPIIPMAYSAIDQGNRAILDGAVYKRIAAKHGVTPAQVSRNTHAVYTSAQVFVN